ncbi:MAG: hypothetical protein ACXWRZ_08310 [Bdellovibrio sp.]
MSLTQTTHIKASADFIFKRRRSVKSAIFYVFSFFVLATASPALAAEGEAPDPTLVEDKYSLKADLKAFEELRKNISPSVRSDNEEKAFMDQLMSDLTKTPAEVRNQFSKIVNKKREIFNKDMIKLRQEFSKYEKKERDGFTDQQTESRKNFTKKKVTSDERKEFFEDAEAKRKEFYLEVRERRDEFEADVREKRRNFDDYIKSRTDEFNQLHRDYTKRYEENKKAMADGKKVSAEKRKQLQKDIDKDYEPIRQKSPTRLEPNTDGEE